MKLFSVQKNIFKKSAEKGFTLIELLVVIGILGVLAAALVATIDPFEQLKKAQDANVKNTAVEFLTANVRYYTTHNAMPWNDTAGANAVPAAACASAQEANVVGGSFTAATGNLNAMSSCLGLLVTDGEVKSGFTTVTNILTSIAVSGSANSVTACYQPQSKSQRNDPNTKYSAGGAVTTGCVSQTAGGSTSCYWCSQ